MPTFVADDPTRLALLLLRRLTSPSLVRKLLRRKAEKSGHQMADELLARKAEGVASAVESGLGYWNTPNHNLNAALLSRYYAVVQFTIAEQVASPLNADDLKAIQKHTRAGHGLASFSVQIDKPFPHNQAVALLRTGHFAEYFLSLGLPARSMALPARPKEEPVPATYEEISKVVTFSDLFRRVPELRQIIPDHLGLKPLTMPVAYESKETLDEEIPKQTDGTYSLLFNDTAPKQISRDTTATNISYLSLHPDEGVAYSAEEIAELNLGLEEVRAVHRSPEEMYFIGKYRHQTEFWQESLNPYRSRMSGMTLIAPLWGKVRDPYLIHTLLLYGLSIVVRYLPSIWHEITSGHLDDVRSLVEFYLNVVDTLIPEIAFKRITGELASIEQPGSIFAPV